MVFEDVVFDNDSCVTIRMVVNLMILFGKTCYYQTPHPQTPHPLTPKYCVAGAFRVPMRPVRLLIVSISKGLTQADS